MTQDRAEGPVIVIAHRNAETYRRLLGSRVAHGEIVTGTDDEAPELAPRADILLTIGRWLTPEIMARCTNLRWIQCLITGTDHLVAPLGARPDVILTNAQGLHGPQMSETTMLHILALSRGGRRLARQQQDRQAERFTPMTLEGRVVTILGVGSIAEHLAGVCGAFGMRVVGVSSRRQPVPHFDAIYPRSTLLEAVAQADFVVALLPLAADTRDLIGAKVFEAMKPSAFFINMARGEIVDEAALIAALRGGTIAGAALDVFRQWPLPADSPLWDLENLLISPFIGGQSDRYEEKLMSVFLPNLEAFMAGRIDEMVSRVQLGARHS